MVETNTAVDISNDVEYEKDEYRNIPILIEGMGDYSKKSLYQKSNQKKTGEDYSSKTSYLINRNNKETPITIEHRNLKTPFASDQEVKLIHTHDSPELNTSSESNTCIVREVPIVLLKEKRKRSSIHIPIRITSFEAGGNIADDNGLDWHSNVKREKSVGQSSNEVFGDISIQYVDASASDQFNRNYSKSDFTQTNDELTDSEDKRKDRSRKKKKKRGFFARLNKIFKRKKSRAESLSEDEFDSRNKTFSDERKKRFRSSSPNIGRQLNEREGYALSKSSSTLPTSGSHSIDYVGDSLKRPTSLSSLGAHRSDQYVETSPMVDVPSGKGWSKNSSSIYQPRSPTGTIPKSSTIDFGKKSRLDGP